MNECLYQELHIFESWLLFFRHFAMKKFSKYSWLLFLLLTEVSFCQEATTSANAKWLMTIADHAIKAKSFREGFHHAPYGFALYYSKSDSLNIPFLVYVPKSYDSSKSHSLIVYLHGGVAGIDSFQYKNASFASNEPIFSIAEKYSDIVLYPFGRKDFGWVKQPAAFENIMTEISEVEKYYNIDRNNIFLGGMSNGGSAAFWFITNHPQTFKAFYAFSAMPKLYQSEINFQNIKQNKPLYSVNAKNDAGYSFSKVKAIYEEHKREAAGWHFDSIATGNHGFIYDDSGWVVMNDLFEELNVFSYKQKSIYDSIAQLLKQVDYDDQKYRNNIDVVQGKYGGGSKEMKSLFRTMSMADSLNLIIVEKIIDENGWLGADEIGEQANNTLFMVIQHNDLRTQETYLPVMREAVANNKAKASDLALLEDRVALREGRSQIYGSQVSWNMETNIYIILPITDPDNLDKRRAAVGLDSYTDYLKGIGLTWNLEQYKKDLPEIERQFKSKK